MTGMSDGSGCIKLALHRAGPSTALLCEIDNAARAVLNERVPGVPPHDDIPTLPRLKPEIDLLAAGFPCQDLSQAGKTRGIRGRQSRLVAHVFDLLGQRPVPWVLLETVPFMLQLESGRAMEHVVGERE